MKNYLIGNSLVHGFRFPTSLFHETICMPGANLSHMTRRLREREDVRNGILYVMEGSIRFSRVIKSESRHEVVLREGASELEPLAGHYRTFQAEMRRRGLKVVFCQMPAMSIDIINRHYANKFGTRRMMRSFYCEWQAKLDRLVKTANRTITAANRQARVHTPWTSKGTIRSGRRVTFSRLRDGLHPSTDLETTWKREIQRVVALNNIRYA